MDQAPPQIDHLDVDFDAVWYAKTYPDIAAALADGALLSPIQHYLRHGRQEGRRPNGQFLDCEWYLKAYPGVSDEIGSTAPEAVEKFHAKIGRYRGYIPQPTARRITNGAFTHSPFGGLWIDANDVADMIDGRYELGLIDKKEAKQLKFFAENGYIVLKSAVPPAILDRAEEALEGAYEGKFEHLRFECHRLSPDHVHWRKGVKDHPAKALDIHWLSEEIRDAAFCPAILRFLHLIFERPAFASQSLGFYRGSAQEMHQDTAYVAYTIPRQFTASWIALEDVSVGGGELMYFPESHRKLPEFVYGEHYKGMIEAKRMGVDSNILKQENVQHLAAIESEAQRLGLRREKLMAKRGDVLLWHADLAHGGSPISSKVSRKSVVHHYCPKGIAPLFMEPGRKTIKRHAHGAFYTTGVY